MAFDHEQVFKAMESAYRNGVLDKVMFIQGRAMELALQESGLNLVDLLNRVDEADDEAVSTLEKILEYSGPAVRIVGSDIIMKLTARLLDIEKVRELVININKQFILKMLKDDSCNTVGSCCREGSSAKGVI